MWRIAGAVSAAAVSFAGKVRALLRARPPTGPSVPGDAALYRTLTTLARALAQYLLVFSKLPSHLQLPPEKERDTVKFVVMTLEVSRCAGTRAQSGGKSEGAARRGRRLLCLKPSGAGRSPPEAHLPAVTCPAARPPPLCWARPLPWLLRCAVYLVVGSPSPRLCLWAGGRALGGVRPGTWPPARDLPGTGQGDLVHLLLSLYP